MKQYNRVYASINLDAVAYNMEQMKKRLGGDTKLIAVVKTDGYGHGAIPIAQLFEDTEYVWGYATASLDEAMVLRGSWDSKAGSGTGVCISGTIRRYDRE